MIGMQQPQMGPTSMGAMGQMGMDPMTQSLVERAQVNNKIREALMKELKVTVSAAREVFPQAGAMQGQGPPGVGGGFGGGLGFGDPYIRGA